MYYHIVAIIVKSVTKAPYSYSLNSLVSQFAYYKHRSVVLPLPVMTFCHIANAFLFTQAPTFEIIIAKTFCLFVFIFLFFLRFT